MHNCEFPTPLRGSTTEVGLLAFGGIFTEKPAGSTIGSFYEPTAGRYEATLAILSSILRQPPLLAVGREMAKKPGTRRKGENRKIATWRLLVSVSIMGSFIEPGFTRSIIIAYKLFKKKSQGQAAVALLVLVLVALVY